MVFVKDVIGWFYDVCLCFDFALCPPKTSHNGRDSNPYKTTKRRSLESQSYVRRKMKAWVYNLSTCIAFGRCRSSCSQCKVLRLCCLEQQTRRANRQTDRTEEREREREREREQRAGSRRKEEEGKEEGTERERQRGFLCTHGRKGILVGLKQWRSKNHFSDGSGQDILTMTKLKHLVQVHCNSYCSKNPESISLSKITVGRKLKEMRSPLFHVMPDRRKREVTKK